MMLLGCGSLYTLTIASAEGMRIDQKYDSLPGQSTHARRTSVQFAYSEGPHLNNLWQECMMRVARFSQRGGF
jgi:hypothetical protein